MLQAQQVTQLQDQATSRWHRANVKETDELSSLDTLILRQHRTNFDLWHQEDEARDPSAPDNVIAKIKRAIDHLNQQRNDLVETIDLEFLRSAGEQRHEAPLHSETPGLIIDRLSILALKIFHTAEEADRNDATEAHRERNRQRLAVLQQQRNDLHGCLESLWTEVLAGQRRFKLYRQMKMYNDPALNPVLYKTRILG